MSREKKTIKLRFLTHMHFSLNLANYQTKGESSLSSNDPRTMHFLFVV